MLKMYDGYWPTSFPELFHIPISKRQEAPGDDVGILALNCVP